MKMLSALEGFSFLWVIKLSKTELVFSFFSFMLNPKSFSWQWKCLKFLLERAWLSFLVLIVFFCFDCLSWSCNSAKEPLAVDWDRSSSLTWLSRRCRPETFTSDANPVLSSNGHPSTFFMKTRTLGTRHFFDGHPKRWKAEDVPVQAGTKIGPNTKL